HGKPYVSPAEADGRENLVQDRERDRREQRGADRRQHLLDPAEQRQASERTRDPLRDGHQRESGEKQRAAAEHQQERHRALEKRNGLTELGAVNWLSRDERSKRTAAARR